ncbi:CDP-glucose 4,6-dehydratase [Magnetospirillum sp. ME-1]|uniref:CDP-glucose 4,6-dehydratase n=1 Tax=Magnetospirillum sp. ME-1 TaxID=1639348 RepID=UPI000A179A55|nr:CDP-glucose 4,6-dehydratase [Magnetospirillum sp. ME-1]ARJ68150.1 CDP-glucose 4,6-dehydratase [Magnetospirillum sp. ME-1]
MGLDLSALKGRRVLLTGDTGFKGSWLALWLKELGAEVTGIALAPEHADGHYRSAGLESLYPHIDHDIRDGEGLAALVAEARPEVVFHLAAQALVRRSYDDPKTTFDTNVGGSVNVLEAIRRTPSVRAAVYITSDKCYRNKEWVWGYRESDELGGHDPYSASKAAAELVVSSYADSFFARRDGFGIASVRAGNVIGGGDWAQDRIVPDCMRALRDKRPIVLRNPDATRPWQHVLEPLGGYLTLACRLLDEPKRFPGGWNFGPHVASACSVGELVERIVAAWGSGEIRIERDPNAPHECNLLHLNTDKAALELGWHPRWAIDQTVRRTVEWYAATLGGADPRETSLAQIRAYMEAP